MSHRQYDVVVWGATGYTGSLTAQYIAKSFPTDIKWAIAGRSLNKLEAVAESCAKINPDGTQPSIEICNIDEIELADLARKTTILLSTVGPYVKYGEPAIKACAENGTHYMDVTGEIPWVLRMTEKYEKVAQSTGAILISEMGIEAVPSDLLAWSLISFIRQSLSTTTREVIVSVHEIKSQPSGGTISSVLEIMNRFSLSELARCRVPFAHSPTPAPQKLTPKPLLTRLFGVRRLPILGTLTTYIGAASNVPIVERSWGLLGDAKVYGPKFRYSEYMHTSSVLWGIIVHFSLMLGSLVLMVPMFRWALRMVVFAPGDGAEPEMTKNDCVEYRALGWPDADTKLKAYSRVRYEGGIYELTGIFLAEAALTLLTDNVTAKKFGGGFLTPATLGEPYIDRLRGAGFNIETKMILEE